MAKLIELMSHWNVKASTLLILGCIGFLMLLILVLPDVDLPDTAFHRGTAPVVVHSQATAGPAVVTIAALIQFGAPDLAAHVFPALVTPDLVTEPNFRPILLRSIRR